jgi:hypothetical protein
MSPSVTVQVQDQFGNPVTTDSGRAITLHTSTGAIASGAGANTAGGIATFGSIKINTAATGLTMTATATSLTTTPASSTFNVNAASASKLVLGQQPTTVAAGVSMSPAVTVQVQDAFSNPVTTDSGRTVNLNISSGVINAGGSTTTLNGVATFSGLQINTAATGLTVTGASSGLTSTATSSAFNVTAGTANKLVFVQQPSDVNVGASMTPAVTVRVQDQFGNSVTSDNGRGITLTPSTGAIASGDTANTVNGLATFGAITINQSAASLTLTASASPLVSTAPSSVFSVSVLVANGATLTDTATDIGGSGVGSVSYYYCAGFSGSCASGTLIDSSSTGPNFSVTWNGQPANGPYRIVAVGTDNVTNTSTASASIPVTVLNQQSQTINFTTTPPAAGTAGSGSHTYNVAATATSGLAVTITLDATSTGCTLASSTVTFTGAGTCIIDANQGGNALYTAAPQAQQSITTYAALAVESVTSSNAGSITSGTSSQTITFDNPLNPATVPSSGTLTFSAGCLFLCATTTVTMTGLTNGAVDTGSQGWVAHSNIFGTNTISYAVTYTLSGDHKSITVTVGSCTANCTNTANGTAATYKFTPVSSIADVAGDGSAAEFDVPGFFVF